MTSQLQNAILLILMAADPRSLSIEEIKVETIDATEEQIMSALNDLHALAMIEPTRVHPPDLYYRPSAHLTEPGKLHLRNLMASALVASALRDALHWRMPEGEDHGDVSDHLLQEAQP